MYIDAHVHCRDEEQIDKETIAHDLEVAKRAGVDAIFDMPNTERPVTDRRRVDERLALADAAKSSVFYGLYVGLTPNPEQVRDAVRIHSEYFPRVVGLKMYAGKSVGDLEIIKKEEQDEVYRALSDYRGVLAVHCEKESFMKPKIWNADNPITRCRARPPEAEMESIKDQVELAMRHEFPGTLHIVHISTPEGVEYVDKVRLNFNGTYGGLRICCGVTPHHLFFYDEMMRADGGLLLKMNPPLRDRTRQARMIELLREGKIDWVETDHAPHTLEDKRERHMSGVPWLGTWPDFMYRLERNGFSKKRLNGIGFDNAARTFGINILKTDNRGTGGYLDYDASVSLV